MKRAARTITGPKGSVWDVFIGLEVHAQISLRSKLFSRSQAAAPSLDDEPNSRVSLFDAAFPGTLPALNGAAVDQAVLTALALGSDVRRRSIFERKHYFYSDLPHGYQITQQRHPIATGGALPLFFDPDPRGGGAPNGGVAGETPDKASGVSRWPSIGITRIQLEVDSGKSLHDRGGGVGAQQQQQLRYSLVDLNRAGAALMEIVFEPEIRGAAEAGATVRSLQLLLRRVGACDGNMEDGSMRCDLNVSLRPAGATGLGERVEVKNMNSVRHMMTAAAAEAFRQARQLESGEGPIERETRGFDVSKGETVRLRSKEGQVDYRFFPEPDLPPLVVPEARVKALKQRLPELPQATLSRLARQYGLSEDLSRLIVCAAGGASGYYESLVNRAWNLDAQASPRDSLVAATWLTNNVFGLLKDHLGRDGEASDDTLERLLPAERLGGLLDLLADGTISSQTAKSLLRIMVQEDNTSTAIEIVDARELRQITDVGEIEALCRGIVEDPQHATQLASYRGGKTTLSKFFMGKAFQATRGRADGRIVENCITRLIQPKCGPDETTGP